MSPLPKQILEGARPFTAEGGWTLEDAASLDLTGELRAGELVSEWARLGTEIGACGWLRAEVVGADGDPDVDADGLCQGTVTGPITIRIWKPPIEGVSAYFSSSAFFQALTLRFHQELARASQVFVAEATASFTTDAFAVTPWTAACQASESRKPNSKTSPRLVVRDNTHGNLVPSEIEPWLLKTVEDRSCPAFMSWSSAAINCLAYALASEVRDRDGIIEIIVTGIGRRVLTVSKHGDQVDPKLFDALQAAASWVYSDGREVEVRHTLLSMELCRIWAEGQDVWEGLAVKLPFALEAAKIAYRAHIRQTSKDTLKSLTDLRKAVADEVTKVTDQTRALTTALWGDFSLAVAAVVVRLGAISSVSNQVLMRPLLWVIAIYLVITLGVRLWNNDRGFVTSDMIVRQWHERIYSFLPAKEFNDLVREPIGVVRRAYADTMIFIVIVYFALAALLIGAAHDLLPTMDAAASGPKP
jgi:hypothetical protein